MLDVLMRACFLVAVWVIGLMPALLPALGAVLVLAVLADRRYRFPAGAGPWLVFLLIAAASVVTIGAADRALSFIYRYGCYLVATLVLVWTYSRRHDGATWSRVAEWFAAGLLATAACGLASVFLPTIEYTGLLGLVTPESWRGTQFVSDLIAVRTTVPGSFLESPVPRPVAPFTYTNQWAATFVTLLTATTVMWGFASGAVRRTLGWVLLVSAVLGVPALLYSVSRASWLALIGFLVVAVLLRALTGRRIAVAVAAAACIGTVILVMFGGIIADRVSHGHSDEERTELVREAIRLTAESPVLGYGAPQKRQGASEERPAAGTHGQVWTVAVSHGVFALAAYIAWWVVLMRRWWRARQADGGILVAFGVASLAMLPFYESLPYQQVIAMAIAGLAWTVHSNSPSENQE